MGSWIKKKTNTVYDDTRRPQGSALRKTECFPGGDSLYDRGGDARRLAQGYKFRILVSLRVFWAKHHYI